MWCWGPSFAVPSPNLVFGAVVQKLLFGVILFAVIWHRIWCWPSIKEKLEKNCSFLLVSPATVVSQRIELHLPLWDLILRFSPATMVTSVYGRQKDFPRGEQGDFYKLFLGGAKSGEICFFLLETKNTTFFCWNFQNPGGPRIPCLPSDAHASMYSIQAGAYQGVSWRPHVRF